MSTLKILTLLQLVEPLLRHQVLPMTAPKTETRHTVESFLGHWEELKSQEGYEKGPILLRLIESETRIRMDSPEVQAAIELGFNNEWADTVQDMITGQVVKEMLVHLSSRLSQPEHEMFATIEAKNNEIARLQARIQKYVDAERDAAAMAADD